MRVTLLIALVASCWLPGVTRAQADDGTDAEQAASEADAEARLLFEVGRRAFDDARFEEALGHFRRAFELSGRVALLYNVAVAADRLRRDAEALEAFEQFIRSSPDGAPGLQDANVRVRVLRAQQASPDDSGPSLVGPLLLGAAGIGLLAVPVVGALTTDDCSRMDGSVCVEERSLDAAWASVYLSAGLLALAGALAWYLLSDSGEPEDGGTARLGPGGLEVTF